MLIPIPKDTSGPQFVFLVITTVNALIERIFPRNQRVAADYTAEAFDGYVGVTDTAAARTITLPANTLAEHRIVIKDESGGAGTNNIIIDGAGSETIDGALTNTIATNYGSRHLVSNGAGAWFVVASV